MQECARSVIHLSFPYHRRQLQIRPSMPRKTAPQPSRTTAPGRGATLRAPILGKGGAHGKTQKAERSQAKQRLRKTSDH